MKQSTPHNPTQAPQQFAQGTTIIRLEGTHNASSSFTNSIHLPPSIINPSPRTPQCSLTKKI